ncbi:hypothetical protein, partial [Lysobacter capsici]|uniref:hypothetical protein n=1 Tax=Lysobacter capsici TaxID=435897 RepID=UPI00398CC023
AHIHVRRPSGVLLFSRVPSFAALDELRDFWLKPKPKPKPKPNPSQAKPSQAKPSQNLRKVICHFVGESR